MPKKRTLFEKVYHIENLRKAWSQIYENSLKSTSKETKSKAQEFKFKEHENLYKIRRELRDQKFVFDGIKGIGIKKADKNTPRPIVLSPPAIRIVQRSILNVLQRQSPVKKFLDVAYSFGAIRKKGVPDAIQAAVKAIKSGATYYIKSDIASFFTRIALPKVMHTLSQSFPNEEKFIELLKKATHLEVENLIELEKKYGADFKQLFIFDEVGTPQGCCLSPLLGNILLYDFDMTMNSRDIICLRYLDDFVIFGSSLKKVNAAFQRGLEILEPLGLTAYDPKKDKDKASYGAIIKPFEFLGVEFHGKKIRPAQKARKKFLNEVDEIIRGSKKVDFTKVIDGSKEDYSLIKSLYQIHNKVKGWGNQYYFCNDPAIWGSLDAEIMERINNYFLYHYAKRRKLNQKQERRQLGIHLLTDSKSEPIVW